LRRRARVGVRTSRTLGFYAGVRERRWAEAAYTPIDPNIPDAQLIQILRITLLDAAVEAGTLGVAVVTNTNLRIVKR